MFNRIDFFTPLLAKVFAGLSLALLISLAFTWQWGKAGWRNAESWELAHRNQKAATIATQKAAEAKAIAAKIQTENKYALLARQADSFSESRERMSRAADRYARSHRVRPEAIDGHASGASAPGQGDPAKGGDGPGSAPSMVAVTRDDFDLLVANSLRLEQVRRWGESLVNERLAIPEVEFGK